MPDWFRDVPPEQLAAEVQRQGLGEGRIFNSVKEMVPHVDVVAIFAPNYTRIEVVEEIIDAVQGGRTAQRCHLRKTAGPESCGGSPHAATGSGCRPAERLF